jgi:hypothetical protein
MFLHDNSFAVFPLLKSPTTFLALFSELLLNPLTTLVLVLIWAIPLVSSLGRGGNSFQIPNAYLGEPSVSLEYHCEPRLHRIKTAVLWGFFAALGYMIILLVFKWVVHQTLSDSTLNSQAFKMKFYFGQALVAVAVQVAVSLALYFRIRFLPVYHSMMAAFVAAIIITVGIFLTNILITGKLTWGYTDILFFHVTNAGQIFTLILLGAISICGRWLTKNGANSKVMGGLS